MIPPRRHLVLLTLLLPAAAQTPIQPPAPAAPKPTLNHAIVFVDPAHGGDDPGARLINTAGEPLLEKDLTLALASRLRSQLASFGLTVLTTREPETVGAAPAPAPPTPDQRAGIANHVHPFACIVLHATGTGTGVHLITSALPSSTSSDTPTLIPWDSAQASFLPQSDRLAAELSTAIARAGIPVHSSRATLRPLDSLTCPAVLIELAPLPSASLADSGYQARVAQAVATALLFWRGHAEPDFPAAGDPGTSSGNAQP